MQLTAGGAVFCFWALLSAVLTATGCRFQSGSKDKNEKTTVAPVVVCRVSTGDIAEVLRMNTVVEARSQVDVVAKSGGEVTGVFAEEGDWVKSGKVLAKLDDAQQTLAVEKARAAVAQHQNALARAEELRSRQMLAPEEYERLTLALEDARIALRQAELNLEYTEVKAPISGLVTARLVNRGEQATPGRPMFKIVDRSQLILNCWVAESDLPHLRRGMEAQVSAARSDQRFLARLERVSPVVDPQYGKVKATFILSDPDGALKPGQLVELAVVTRQRSDVVLIPKKAVVHAYPHSVVFAVRDTLAFRTPVEVGLQTADSAEVVSGLKAGDWVVVEGQSTLKDSSRVNIIARTGG